MSRRVQAILSINAIHNNLERIKILNNNNPVLLMVKGDGYGHGAVRIAHLLQSKADAFGVASLQEALILRKSGISKPIVVMVGFLSNSDLECFFEHQITSVIHNSQQVRMLENSQYPSALNIWLKIDTGMRRLGFQIDEAPRVYQRLQQLARVKKPFGVMTHLADADNSNPQYTAYQLSQFLDFVQHCDGPISIASSARLLSPQLHKRQWGRCGGLLYGLSPLSGRCGLDEGLSPVMTLQAKIIAVKQCKKGDFVGYGCTWKCPETMPLGVVAIGYADGYPRHAKSGTPVLVDGTICPLVGRVSMDFITIDLRRKPDAKFGDMVTLWGEGLPAETVATHADTICYQLLSGVRSKVEIIEKDD